MECKNRHEGEVSVPAIPIILGTSFYGLSVRPFKLTVPGSDAGTEFLVRKWIIMIIMITGPFLACDVL
jgi:hypothetical protein